MYDATHILAREHILYRRHHINARCINPFISGALIFVSIFFHRITALARWPPACWFLCGFYFRLFFIFYSLFTALVLAALTRSPPARWSLCCFWFLSLCRHYVLIHFFFWCHPLCRPCVCWFMCIYIHTSLWHSGSCFSALLMPLQTRTCSWFSSTNYY
jgi:hypothetical protein